MEDKLIEAVEHAANDAVMLIRRLDEENDRLKRAAESDRVLMSTLLYWHDCDGGHIDESWWEAVRERVKL